MTAHIDEDTRLIKISWSKIRTSEECRQKAYLLASGMKSPISDVRVFFQGNVVDQAMRRWLSMDEPPPGWMVQHVDEILDDTERQVMAEGDGVVRWRHRDDRAQVRDFCREAARRLEILLRHMAIPYEWQPAVRFKVPLTIPGLDGQPMQVLLTGEMDLLLRECARLPDQVPRDQIRVLDLKITKDAQYYRKTMAQLTFYDLVCICMQLGPTQQVGLLQPMVEGEPVKLWSVSDEDRTQMCTRIISVAHGILRGDVAPKAGTDGCDRCEVRHACIRYKTEPGSHKVALF